MNAELHEFVNSLRFGEVQRFGPMSIPPVFSVSSSGPEYYLLSDKDMTDNVRMEETSPGGTVSGIPVTNMNSPPLLLVEGEELWGAKQNRISKTTILVKPNPYTSIPVTCVEQGGWRRVSK